MNYPGLRLAFLSAAWVMLPLSMLLCQNYPIQIQVAVLPPYSTHLSDYFTYENQIVITVSASPALPQNTPLKFAGVLSGDNGILISTQPNFQPPSPFFLNPGQTRIFSGIDLGPYFDINQVVFSGTTRQEIEQSGTLPEGYYTLCLTVQHFQTGQLFSEPEPGGCSGGFLIQNVEPPVLLSPECGVEISPGQPQNVVFSWSYPAGVTATVRYLLKIVEVFPPDRNPNDAMNASTTPPFFERMVEGQGYVYGLTDPPLQPGKTYAVQITALDPSNTLTFNNQGRSEVCGFTTTTETGQGQCICKSDPVIVPVPGDRFAFRLGGSFGCSGYCGSGPDLTECILAAAGTSASWFIGPSGKDVAAIDGDANGDTVKIKPLKPGNYNLYVNTTTVCSCASCKGVANLELYIPDDPPPNSPKCQITLDAVKEPMMVGGLSPACRAPKSPMLRDEFIALEAVGSDLDQLKITCQPESNCPDHPSDMWLPLSGRVKFTWLVTSDDGEFKKLGCLPAGSKSAEGEHVILMPPYVPMPASDSKPEKVSVRIRLTVVDDNPTQPTDKDVPVDIEVEFTRNYAAQDHYDVKISAPPPGEPGPANEDKIEDCEPQKPVWTMDQLLDAPTILLPASVEKDNNKMVVGEWIVLEAADRRDIDKLTKLECHSTICEDSKADDRTYEDNVNWEWKVRSGGGRILLSPFGRFVIYEAPLALEEDEAQREVVIETRVFNPGGKFGDPQEKKGTVTLTVHQAGIGISHPDAAWIPTDDNNTALTSTLLYCTSATATGAGAGKKIEKTWAPGFEHMCRIHFFEIDSVSKEPGVCLNSPEKNKAETCPDLCWKIESDHEAFNEAPHSTYSKCKTGDIFQSARTKKPMREYAIDVHALDFGAYGQVSSYARFKHKTLPDLKTPPYYESVPVGKTQAPPHPDKRSKAKVYWDNRVAVPLDIDGNHIPDKGWEASITKADIPDPARNLADDDNKPSGDGTNGDGFSNYEEYRGFKIIDPADESRKKSIHIRLDNNSKELFIHNPDTFDISLYQKVSGVTPYQIQKDQFDGTEGTNGRWVNFNNASVHGDDQRGIYLHRVDNIDGNLGIANPCIKFELPNGGPDWRLPAPPNFGLDVQISNTAIAKSVHDHNAAIASDSAKIKSQLSILNKELAPIIAKIAALDAQIAQLEKELAKEKDAGKKKNIQKKIDDLKLAKSEWEKLKTTKEAAIAKYTARLAEILAAKMSVYAKKRQVVAHELCHANNAYHHGEARNGLYDIAHGPRSGNVDCIMHYDNVGTLLDPPKTEAPGSILCTSPAGTGSNANGPNEANLNFGDCDRSATWARGNCARQIRIKCAWEKNFNSRNSPFPIRVDF